MAQRDNAILDATARVSYNTIKRDRSQEEPRLFGSNPGMNPVNVGISQYTDSIITANTRRDTNNQRLPMADSYFDEDFINLPGDKSSSPKPKLVESEFLGNKTGLILNTEKINKDNLMDFLIQPKQAITDRDYHFSSERPNLTDRNPPKESNLKPVEQTRGKTYTSSKRGDSFKGPASKSRSPEKDLVDLSYSRDPYANSGHGPKKIPEETPQKTPQKISAEQFNADVVSRLDGWQQARISKVAKLRQQQAEEWELQNTHHPKLMKADSNL